MEKDYLSGALAAGAGERYINYTRFPFRKEFLRNPRAILADLEKYNEDELFYRRCHELRFSPKELADYIALFDEKELEGRLLEFPVKRELPAMTEAYLFGKAENLNALLCKHSRYTPAYKHYHDYFEVFYVMSGQCINTIGAERFMLSSGSLCFIAPFINHTLEVFDDSIVINICIRKTTFDSIFFNLLTSQNILSGFFTGNLYPVDPVEYLVFDIGGDDELLDKIFSMLIEQSRGDEYSGRIMDNLVSIFFALVIRKEGKGEGGSIHVEQNRYIAYINEHFRTVSLPNVAEHFGISVAYCSRLIKTLTGKKFHELVRDIRFRQALVLLTSTNIKIGVISEILGFRNQETFMRNFRKIFNLSPSQYRSARKSVSTGKG